VFIPAGAAVPGSVFDECTQNTNRPMKISAFSFIRQPEAESIHVIGEDMGDCF